jgi:predicted enzyme related to lactoylglutathione lyase
MGQPVVQWQILSKNLAQLAEFYSKLFGWTIKSDNALKYHSVHTGSEKGIKGGFWPAPPEGRAMVTFL